MKEIKRLQELAGINEVKIISGTENKNIIVTDKGKQYVEDYYKLMSIARRLEVDELLNDDGPQSEIFNKAQLLNIMSDKYGESIINIDSPTKLEDFSKNFKYKWDDQEDVDIDYIKELIKYGLIKSIKI